MNQSIIGTIPTGGAWGGGSPPNVSTPFLPGQGRRRRRRVEQKSCFDEAENRAASSLGVGGHRYTRISCVSKLLWFQGDLKPFFFKAINSLKSIQRSRESLEIVQNWASSSFRYGYGVIQLNFVRVKTQMGLEQFETEPRTQTPFDRFVRQTASQTRV